MREWLGTAALIGVVLLANVSGQQGGHEQAQEPQKNKNRTEAFVSGEMLVRFSPTLNASQKNSILSSRRAIRIRRFDALDIDLVRVPPGQAVAASVGGFKGVQGVVLAQPNYFRYAIQSAPPNDPRWLDGSLWGLGTIQAKPVWTDYTRGDGSVVVASIDSGVDYLHPDLAPNMWRNPLEIPGNGIDDDNNGYVDDVYGIDTGDQDSDPMDANGHGTLTAGVIAARGNNGVGGTGVSWNSKILACKFLDAEGVGTDAGAIACFDYIVQLKNRGVNIRVSNNGWGALRNAAGPALALQAAIDAAGAAGILNIFGAGNDGVDTDATPFDPASFASPSIVSVASSDRADARSAFSNAGAASVDLAAPGEDILSTSPDGDYESVSGTSLAAAHAAGVVALLSTLDPARSPAGLKSLLLDNVDRLPQWTGNVVSGGRLSALRSILATGVGPNTPPSVSIAGPAQGAVYETPVGLTIEATASDSDGTIQGVEFFVNGVSIGSDTTAPFTQAWNTATVGNYVFTAVATDSMDKTATSSGVSVQVKLPNVAPAVTLTGPTHGASFVAPAAISLTADGTDSDGTIASVTFYVDGAPIGTDTVSPYGVVWNAAGAGSFTITASATDDSGATSVSNAAIVSLSNVQPRLNVALASNGGVASASSTLAGNYPPASTINGDRRGIGWANGGGWNDGTQHVTPDWLMVEFNGPKTIDEVSVFFMQDAFSAPVEPTPTLAANFFGVRGFEIQYWTGSDWAAVPGTTVTNNNLVWRRFAITPVTTTRIRVFITAPLNGYSRLIEVEAWGVAAFSPIVASLRPVWDPRAKLRSMLH